MKRLKHFCAWALFAVYALVLIVMIIAPWGPEFKGLCIIGCTSVLFLAYCWLTEDEEHDCL